MNNNDYVELLAFTRKQVQASRYSDVDDFASLEARGAETVKSRLESYLRMVIGTVRERSQSPSIRTNARLIRFIEVESGEPFSGVEVFLGGEGLETFDIERFNLTELDDNDLLIVSLEGVLRDLKDEPEPPFFDQEMT